MLFNSLGFLLLFLPITLLLFYKVIPPFSKVRIWWLVLASLFFYAWWKPVYLLLLTTSILCNYFLAQNIIEMPTHSKGKRYLLVLGVTFNLGLIAFFKYANFLVDSVNLVASTQFHLEKILLPLAISFFTFQQIAYLVDAYQEKIKQQNFSQYCLFVTFFPQLIAGPIVQHCEIIPQMSGTFLTNKKLVRNIAIGLSIFMIGLAKKIIIADTLAVPADKVFFAASNGLSLSLFEAWLGAFCYTFQLYFDFSGYSDMAIGLAQMFGIKLPVNFNSPYKATSIIEFWRRWHITLSRFLRDYLYIPLGGNKHGQFARYKNLMLTMLLGGLWHGAGWNFVIWGGMHGLYLIINHGWRNLVKAGIKSKVPFQQVSYQFITFMVVVLAWVVFRSDSLFTIGQMFKAMFGLEGISLPNRLGALGLANIPFLNSLGISFNGMFYNQLVTWSEIYYMLMIAAVLAFMMPNTQTLFRRVTRLQPGISSVSHAKVWMLWRPTLMMGVATGILTVVCLCLLSKPSAFLYYNF